MKKAFYSVVLLGILIVHLAGCKQVDEWTKYKISYSSEQEFGDTSFVIVDSTYIVTGEFFLDFNNELSKRGIKEKQIEKITLESLEINTIQNSLQKDFSFVDSFEFSMKGENFPERTLAAGDSMRANLEVVKFELNDRNGMEDLLKANEYVVKFRFKLKKKVDRSIRFRIRTRFELDARQFFI